MSKFNLTQDTFIHLVLGALDFVEKIIIVPLITWIDEMKLKFTIPKLCDTICL